MKRIWYNNEAEECNNANKECWKTRDFQIILSECVCLRAYTKLPVHQRSQQLAIALEKFSAVECIMCATDTCHDIHIRAWLHISSYAVYFLQNPVVLKFKFFFRIFQIHFFFEIWNFLYPLSNCGNNSRFRIFFFLFKKFVLKNALFPNVKTAVDQTVPAEISQNAIREKNATAWIAKVKMAMGDDYRAKM